MATRAQEYPFFLGRADERGAGPGEGFNRQLSAALGHGFPAWADALEIACARVADFGAGRRSVSLGVDTFEEIRSRQFRLESADFPHGRRIAGLGLPTLFVMEGGYAVEEIGINAVDVLQGFEEG